MSAPLDRNRALAAPTNNVAGRARIQRALALLLALATVVLAGCGKRGTRPNELVLLVDSSPSQLPHSLDPRYTGVSLDIKLSRLIFAALVSEDQASMEPKLDLAASVTPVDPTTWDIVVRPDARFADGTPVTALDVYQTFHALMAADGQSTTQRAFQQRIAGLRLLPHPAGLAIRFHLKEPLATFVTDLDMGILPAASLARWGLELPLAGYFGAGPFRLGRLDPDGQAVTLERNPHYVLGASRIDRVVVRTIRDDNSRLLALVGGSADLMQGGLPPPLIAAVGSRPELEVTTAPSALLTYLGFNHDDAILKHREVRQAIALALDREAIIRSKFKGKALLATGLMAPGHWAYDGAVTRYPHDLVRARALLDAAGYPDPPGPAPRFTLVYKTSNNRFRLTIARALAYQLGEVGIAIDLRALEGQTFLSDLKAGNFQLFTYQSGEIVEPDMAYAYYHSSRVPTKERKDLTNRVRYRNPEMDRLTELGRRTIGRDARIGIYQGVQRLMADDLPIVPLWHEDNILVRRVRVQDYEVYPNARYAGLARAYKSP